MDEEIAITKVQEKLARIRAEIALAKRKLEALEAEARDLTTTLGVLSKLGEENVTIPLSGVRATSHAGMLMSLLINTAPISAGDALVALFKKTTRQLIAEQFVTGAELTRIEVTERVKALDEETNAQTVATTLSKLTADGVLEKAEGGRYRLRKVDPGAENTGDTDDLLET